MQVRPTAAMESQRATGNGAAAALLAVASLLRRSKDIGGEGLRGERNVRQRRRGSEE